MLQVRLRNFQPEDLFQVLRLANRTLNENYEGGLFLHLADLYPDGFIVAEDGGKIVGFILGVVERAYEARILIVTVDEHHRGRRIGHQLVTLFIERFRRGGVRRVKLEVRISNVPAIQLYERLGFERKKVLPGYYADGEDAYLMSRTVA